MWEFGGWVVVSISWELFEVTGDVGFITGELRISIYE